MRNRVATRLVSAFRRYGYSRLQLQNGCIFVFLLKVCGEGRSYAVLRRLDGTVFVAYTPDNGI
jgi:hypothetical protein